MKTAFSPPSLVQVLGRSIRNGSLGPLRIKRDDIPVRDVISHLVQVLGCAFGVGSRGP